MIQFDTVQKFSKDSSDAVLKSVGAVSKGTQAAAMEAAEYAKRSFEQGTALVEKLSAARSLETVMQIQGDYLRGAYEGLVSQAGRMGALATDTAKEAFAPMEGLMARSAQAA